MRDSASGAFRDRGKRLPMPGNVRSVPPVPQRQAITPTAASGVNRTGPEARQGGIIAPFGLLWDLGRGDRNNVQARICLPARKRSIS